MIDNESENGEMDNNLVRVDNLGFQIRAKH